MTSISSTTSSGFFYDLFSIGPASHAATEPDVLDHVAAYADTAQGSGDLFRIFETAIDWIQKIPLSASPGVEQLLRRIKDTASMSGIALCIPAIITDCNHLRRSFSHFITVQDLPYSDPLRTRKIMQAAKKGFLDVMNLTNNSTQAVLFADRVNLVIFEANQLRVIDGLYNITSIIMDGAELVGEFFKLKFYHSPEAIPRNPAEMQKLQEKKNLSWMVIAKDTASMGTAGIALIGITSGIAMQSIATVATASLILNTSWLTMKIFSYFYKKIVVEAPLNPIPL